MFVISKKAFRFVLDDGGATKEAQIAPHVITNLPEWVRRDSLFKLACKDGAIAFVDKGGKEQKPQPESPETEAPPKGRAARAAAKPVKE